MSKAKDILSGMNEEEEQNIIPIEKQNKIREIADYVTGMDPDDIKYWIMETLCLVSDENLEQLHSECDFTDWEEITPEEIIRQDRLGK